MNINRYTGGWVETNGYLIEVGGDYVLVDAPKGIANWLKTQKIQIQSVLLTHQHYDHVEDLAELQAQGAKVYGFASYSKKMTLEEPAKDRGFPVAVPPYVVDELLVGSEKRTWLGLEVRVEHVPGHSPDSLVYIFEKEGVVFSGDTLFQGSVGRSDLPGGNGMQLIEGIRKHLLSLPDTTLVLSGHGDESRIGEEKRYNPFL